MRAIQRRFGVSRSAFGGIPGSPLASRCPLCSIGLHLRESLSDVAYSQPGLQTSDNAQFIRYWFEVDLGRIGFGLTSSEDAAISTFRWFPYLKGGDYRKWYGNELYVVDWEHDGRRIKEYVSSKYPYLNGKIDYIVKDRGYYFKPMISYTKIGTGRFAARAARAGYLFDVAGSAVFPSARDTRVVLGFLCSQLGELFLRSQNPTLNVQSGDIEKLPLAPSLLSSRMGSIREQVKELVDTTKRDWDSSELSWEYSGDPTVEASRRLDVPGITLAESIASVQAAADSNLIRSVELERQLDKTFFDSYGIPKSARGKSWTLVLPASG